MNQDKNTIKVILAVVVSVILGEGVLGWGIYWPILLVLVDWGGIYWLGLGLGILISVLTVMNLGLPSLFIVILLGLVSFLLKLRKGLEWWLIVISLIANGLFDRIFGLTWSVVEMLVVLVVAIVVFSWETKSDSIKVRYK